MPQPRKHEDQAARQRAYRERKRNAQLQQSADDCVTFDKLFRAVPIKQEDDRDERYTPLWVIDAARKVLGSIDLDPASCAAAQAIVRAATSYTKADNGLVRPWAGRVWLNPPYSDPKPWIKRLLAHHRADEVSSAIVLLNIAGTPEWARLLWQSGYPVCVLTDRIEFIKADGSVDNRNMYDQFIWYIGQHRRRFAAVFGAYGVIR